jgi:O-antigen ligase
MMTRENGTQWQRLMVLVPLILISLLPLRGGFMEERRFIPDDMEEKEPLLFSMGGSGMDFATLIPYLLLYAIVGIAILYYFIEKKRDPARLYMVWLCGSSLFFLPAIVDFMSGYGISVMATMTPFVLMLVFVLTEKDFDWLIGAVRNLALIYLYANVLYTVIFFNLATVDNCGICPLSEIRLYGLSKHANSLSIIPVVFISADLVRGGDITSRRVLHWIVACTILVATQSKSPMLGMLVAGAVVSILAARGPMKVVIFSATGLIAVIAATIWFVIIPETSASNFYNTASNLTGRPVIWEYVVEMWRNNMFGYGTGFMKVHMPTGENFYFRTGMEINTAHNQLLGALGQAGIAGVIGFVMYFLFLPYIILTSSSQKKYAVLFMYITIFVWCITEQLLSALIISERFFLHMVMFYFVALLVKDDDARGRARELEFAAAVRS